MVRRINAFQNISVHIFIQVCLLQPGEAVGEKVLKSYCWMYSTFNIPASYEGRCARRRLSSDPNSDEPVYNSYYQWVPIVLIFQGDSSQDNMTTYGPSLRPHYCSFLAILFYTPRIVWLMLEGGLMKYLGKGTTGRIVEDSDDKLRQLVQVRLLLSSSGNDGVVTLVPIAYTGVQRQPAK